MINRSKQWGSPMVNRRQFLALMGAGTLGGLLAACGDSDSSTPTSTGSGQTTSTQTTGGQSTPVQSASAVASATGQSSEGGESVLVVGANFVITSLDPGRTVETTSEMINHATYDSLVTFDGEDVKTPKPSLGQKWEVSTDGTSYTFTLQPDVTFVSGNPLTADDVKWSLDRVKNLQGNPAFFLDPVDSVEVSAPDTVVVKLPAPYPGILPILSSPSLGAIDSKFVTEKGGDASPDAKTKDTAEEYLNQHSAGTGAFTMTAYTPGQQVTLEKNPKHWRGAASLGRIVIQNITDPASQKTQLAGGNIDIATALSQDQIPSLKNTKDVVVKTSAIASTFYVLMNNSEVGGPFSNPKVQQAVRYALDYDGIMQLAGEGAQRLAGVIPNLFPGSLDPSSAIKTDPDKAKSLLAEANVGKVSGTLSYSSDSVQFGIPASVLAQKIQSDLMAVGMDIALDGLPNAPALEKYRGAQDQIGIWSWTADYPDASDYLVYAPGRTVGKRAGWPEDASPDAQALVELAQQAETELDDTKRVQLYQQFGQKLSEVGPYAPLFLPAAPYGYRANIEGVTLHSVWGVDFYTIKKNG